MKPWGESGIVNTPHYVYYAYAILHTHIAHTHTPSATWGSVPEVHGNRFKKKPPQTNGDRRHRRYQCRNN
jgi:hypothetical protein